MAMILEGMVTTENEDETVNFAPMGPIVAEGFTHLTLRPFTTSTTYKNLKKSGRGVFHVLDDVLLIAQAALGEAVSPSLIRCPVGRGWVLENACRWYAFEVRSLDDREARTQIEVEVVGSGRLRDFWGFNRAKHAVLELAIIATRLHITAADEVRSEVARCRVIVDKTSGPQEREAFDFVAAYIERNLAMLEGR